MVFNIVDYTKIVLMGDDPEKITLDYSGSATLIMVYPKNKRPNSSFLLKKNIKIITSEMSHFPDIESMETIKNFLFYLINISIFEPKDHILLIFEKRGERYEITLDMSKLRYPTLISVLRDRLSPKLIENVLRLSMSIIRKGREGFPVGALLIVGDFNKVKKYIIQKIANPMRSMDLLNRNVLKSDNFDTLREFAVMDGAMLIDERGYAMSCGSYVKLVSVDEWLSDGIGGRHLAGQAISKLTRAISFVISSEGSIRVYRDGHKIYEMESF